MNTEELNASSRVLIISTGYNNSGFLGGLNSILNQLIYAEEFGFIPVAYFNPWSNDFPDFYRQELFEGNLWQDYFQSITPYSYEEILEFIASANHPLVKRNLHYLSNEEMLYLDFGNPDSVFSGFYGYYKQYQGDRQEWLKTQRKKANGLISQYIQVKKEFAEELNSNLPYLSENTPLLGVVLDCFEKPNINKELNTSLKPYLRSIDQYIENNPLCTILLACQNKKYIRRLQKRYGSRIKLLESETSEKTEKFHQWLVLSKCDYLLKDQSELGEFVLYLNPRLLYKDVYGQFKPISTTGKLLGHLDQETSLFRKLWTHTIKDEGLSIKIFARLVLLKNPFVQLVIKDLERYRYSRYTVLRWIVLAVDFIKLIRNRTYFPITHIKHRAFHADNNIGSGFYSFEEAPQKKYFEIRNTWDTNTGFFAYFMVALYQLKFTETHRLNPIVNFNELHNHYFEPGHSKNIWENYFEPVSELNSEALQSLDGKEVTFLGHDYHNRPGGYIDPPDRDELSTKIWLENHRAMRAILTQKYMRPKAFILDMINDFDTQYLNDHTVLGVHIRGTDKEVDQKGNRYKDSETLVRKIGPEEYFPYVDKYLSIHTQAKIFIATDQQQYLDSFLERYDERIITSTAMRTTSEEPLFRQKKGSKFQRGLEVMCDALLLSRCDYLMKGWSNVSEAAICFNPSIPALDIMYLPDLSRINFIDPSPAVPEDSLRLYESLFEKA